MRVTRAPGIKEPAQGERQASRQRQRFPPVGATISLEAAQVTRPRLLKVPPPILTPHSQRGDRGNRRAEREGGQKGGRGQ